MSCMPQAAPLWMAGALYDPGEAATRSSVILPYATLRALKPDPAAVTTLSDTPAPKISVLGVVVIAVPLFNVDDVPLADTLTSTGFKASTPAYSWMYTTPNAPTALWNVAVTVSRPPAMLVA